MNFLKLLLLSMLPLSAIGQTFFTGGNICKNENWRLVFNDEFSGDSLDRTKWTSYYPNDYVGGKDSCESCRTDQGTVYLDSNVVVSNGTLKLIARHQSVTWFSKTRDYTSGLIYSKGDYEFMYGRFEIRCKIPSGMGLLPNFWSFGGDGVGTATEIDFFEFGGQFPNRPHFGIGKYHETKKLAGYGFPYNSDVDYSQDFHIFSGDWDPFFITFKIDGEDIFIISRFYTLSGTQVTWCCVEPGTYNVLEAFPTTPHNVIRLTASLSIGINGGPYTDAPNNNTIIPAQFEIDYIRVYERDSIDKRFDDECEITLFPNPVRDNLYIKNKRMKAVSIDNVLGEKVFFESATSEQLIVDVSSFSKGVYIVEVETDYDTLVGRFIKY